MRPSKTETPEEKSQREYRERTKSISADRLVPYELYLLRLAVTELSANLGKRTALVELALQVQEQLDKIKSQLKTGTDDLDAAVKDNQPK